MKNKVLFIGNVWPEVTTTAAGRRVYQLIDFFQVKGYSVHFASTSTVNTFAEELVLKDVSIQVVELNNDSFNEFVTDLNPSVVVYDRFMMEEQFGWRVRDCCPDALTILDTEDLHFLRMSREEVLKGSSKKRSEEVKLRELSAVLRSDLSLVISKAELALLIKMGIPTEILYYLPFGVEIPDSTSWMSFDERENFVTIGSFLHAPNVDSVLFLKNEIWPLLRQLVPDAEMHIYGAYCTEKHLQLTNENEKFFVKGFATDALEVIANAKVLLAPLRFGAGLKGKLLEAMLVGTPSITTEVGSEGMVNKKEEWPGFITDAVEVFVEQAAVVYTNGDYWTDCSCRSVELIEKEFNKKFVNNLFSEKVDVFIAQIQEGRTKNLMGQILNYNTNRSTKFMSKWIEAKNKVSS